MREIWYYLTRERFSFLSVFFIGIIIGIFRAIDSQTVGIIVLVAALASFPLLFLTERKYVYVCPEDGCAFRIKTNDTEFMERIRTGHQEEHFWRINEQAQ